MRHAVAFLAKVFDLQLAEFATAERVIEQRRQDRAIPLGFERVAGGRGEELAGLVIAQCRRLTLLLASKAGLILESASALEKMSRECYDSLGYSSSSDALSSFV
jgi:hypothetical protein